MTFSVAKDVVLFALAIYGAALSTWNLIQAIRKDRRAVRVTVGRKMPVGIGGPLEGTAWAHVEATNIGQRPVTVTTIAFEIEGGGRLFSVGQASLPGMQNTDLPVTLADGQTARLHQAYSEIGRALIEHRTPRKCRITAVCVDSAGGTHRGEAWDVDAEELLRM
jgi:hypothetical protein